MLSRLFLKYHAARSAGAGITAGESGGNGKGKGVAGEAEELMPRRGGGTGGLTHPAVFHDGDHLLDIDASVINKLACVRMKKEGYAVVANVRTAVRKVDIVTA